MSNIVNPVGLPDVEGRKMRNREILSNVGFGTSAMDSTLRLKKVSLAHMLKDECAKFYAVDCLEELRKRQPGLYGDTKHTVMPCGQKPREIKPHLLCATRDKSQPPYKVSHIKYQLKVFYKKYFQSYLFLFKINKLTK